MNTLRRHLNRLLGLLCVLTLSGCATLPGTLTPPEVSLADLRLIDVGLFEQRFGLSLRVLNPNEVDIPVEGLSFTLELNDTTFATGVSNESVTIPRLGEAVVDVQAVSTLTGLLHQLRRLSQGEQGITYRIHGTLSTGGMLGGVPFDRRGEIEWPLGPAGRSVEF